MKSKNAWLSSLLSLVVLLSSLQAEASNKDSSNAQVTPSNSKKIDSKTFPKLQTTATKLIVPRTLLLADNGVVILPDNFINRIFGLPKTPPTMPPPKTPPKMPPPLPTDPRELCQHYFTHGTNFESKVSSCPQLALQIKWQQPNGTKVAFNEWTRSQKDRINEIYDRLNRGVADLGLNCTNPRMDVNTDIRNIYISNDEAFDMYAAAIAHSIYLESNHLVSWSLLDNAPSENEAILDSSQYFSIITPYGDEASTFSVARRTYLPGTAYQTPAWTIESGSLLFCDPRISFQFLNGTYSSTHTNLLGANQLSTIKNISWWFHQNVFHGAGSGIVPRPELPEWFRSKVFLQDRLSLATSGTTTGIEVKIGCHSAGNLFLELARGINIPLRAFWYSDSGIQEGAFAVSGHHTGITYHWTQPDAKIVPHADDLYVQYKHVFPLSEDSRAMSEDAKKNYFFEQVWRTPEELGRWGIHYFRTLPLLQLGQDVYQTLPPVRSTRPDMGYYGGFNDLRYIERDEHEEIIFSDYTSGPAANGYKINYELCGWFTYLEGYCQDTTEDHARFYSQLALTINEEFSHLSAPLPITISVDQHRSKIEQCVMANGGCANILRMVNDETMALGQNHLLLPTPR